MAWNGPIAHVMTEQLALDGNVVSLGMRDVDRDFQSIVNDLKNRSHLTGSSDSPQAHVVPPYHLQSKLSTPLGTVTAFDFDLGRHGDTAVGEVKALEVLSSTKQGDAALVSKMMWDRAIQGDIPSLDANSFLETYEEVASDMPPFDHCQIDAIASPNNHQKLNEFGEALISMDWDIIPEEQHLMKLEGIKKKWELPRQSGYDIVRKAMGVNIDQHRPATNFNYQKRSFSTKVPQHINIKELQLLAVALLVFRPFAPSKRAAWR
jgi:hypothetical protein